jgi:hypothetical protein
MGANTALFSLIDALLIRTLNVPEPDRLVFVRQIATLGVSSKKMTSVQPPVSEFAAVEDAVGFRSLVQSPRRVSRDGAGGDRGVLRSGPAGPLL